jgi:hypothetical protein
MARWRRRLLEGDAARLATLERALRGRVSELSPQEAATRLARHRDGMRLLVRIVTSPGASELREAAVYGYVSANVAPQHLVLLRRVFANPHEAPGARSSILEHPCPGESRRAEGAAQAPEHCGHGPGGVSWHVEAEAGSTLGRQGARGWRVGERSPETPRHGFPPRHASTCWPESLAVPVSRATASMQAAAAHFRPSPRPHRHGPSASARAPGRGSACTGRGG